MKMNKNEQGFSLIEILIALVLVGVLFVAVMNGLRQSLSSTAFVRANTIALNLAKERIEFLKSYEGNTTYDRSNSIWLGSPNPYTVTRNNITFSIRTAIVTTNLPTTATLVSANPWNAALFNIQNDANVIPISVTVSWSGCTRPIVVNTFIIHDYK
jgi:prepilin-type N-terminal cleavage/methylation domain-containing protein